MKMNVPLVLDILEASYNRVQDKSEEDCMPKTRWIC